MIVTDQDLQALDALEQSGREAGLDVSGATVRRSSSRFYLGVEQGEYNRTERFAVHVCSVVDGITTLKQPLGSEL